LSELSETSAATIRPIQYHSEPSQKAEPFAVALSIGWLVIPAIQYVGTVERTRRQVGETDEPSTIGLWDLTTIYLLLLLATIAYGLRSYFSRRRETMQQPQIVPDSGEPS
jgi:hypothetical protein